MRYSQILTVSLAVPLQATATNSPIVCRPTRNIILCEHIKAINLSVLLCPSLLLIHTPRIEQRQLPGAGKREIWTKSL
jgi:hypothetical protein